MKKTLYIFMMLFFLTGQTALAQEAEEFESSSVYTFPELPPEFDIYVGYRILDFDDSKRAEEFEYLDDNSITGAADIRIYKLPHRFHLDLDVKNQNDYFGDLSYAYKDLILFRGVHRNIFHNLENIYLGELPAVGRTSVQDRGKEYDVTVGISDASLRLKAPDFPLHVFFKGRLVQKDGKIQQRWLGGSALFNNRIRVSEERDIDWKTSEYTVGVNSHLGVVEAEFTHSGKKLKVDGDEILEDFYTDASPDRVAGVYPHNLIPETKGYTNTLKVHTNYTGKLVAAATVAQKHRENEDSNAKVDYLYGSGGVTWMPITKLTFFLKYRHKELDENTPNSVPSIASWPSIVEPPREAISSKTDTVSLTGRYRPFSRLTLKANYTYDKHDRSDVEPWHIEDETTTHSYSIGADTSMKGLKVNADYTHKNVEDPAYNITPDTTDEGKIGVTWIPWYNVSTFVSYNIVREKRKDIHYLGFLGVPEEADERKVNKDTFFGSLTILPVKDLSLTGSYAYMYHKVDQDLMYHNSPPIAPPFPSGLIDEGVPYTMTSNVYTASAHYHWNDRLSIQGEVTHSQNKAKFKTSAADISQPVSIASFSDLKINETIYSIGGNYRLPGDILFGAEYRYSTFEDKIDDPYDDVEDGTAQIIWLYIGKEWG